MSDTTLLTGTDAADAYSLTPTSDGGITTIDNFGDDDTIEINGYDYDAEYLYHFAYYERSLDMDVDLGLVETDDTTQVLLYTNSAEEGEIATYDELFAVINLESDTGASTVLSGTDDADTFEFTASSEDGLATVTDFGAEDSIVVDGQTFDAEYLYFFAANDRNLTGSVDLDLVGEGDTQQIVLYGDSNDEANAASYDDPFAIIEVEVANGSIA